jgi:2-hydroxychromene-2-carboxylate isomerase
MKHITFYLDFISPYAYLAFEALPEALQGHSVSVTYKPILFAGLLGHYGQLGPAEIPAKREWTYRQVLWLAQRQGIVLQMPASHPFNPLGLLRLALATDAKGLPNRYVCETLFRHVWTGGADAADPTRLQSVSLALSQERPLANDADGATVKEQLKTHGDEAIVKGVFGVPSFDVDGKVFWGQDALPMLRSYLEGDAWFAGADWGAVTALPSGVPHRKR